MMKKGISFLAAIIFLMVCVPVMGETADMIRIENSTLTEWVKEYTSLLLLMKENGNAVEMDTGNGIICSYEQDIRFGVNGERVLDGGIYSENGIYMLGMGAGVDQDDLWYVTLTFGPNVDQQIVTNNTLCMIYAFGDLYRLFSESEESKDTFVEILDMLTSGNESVGFELNGKLLMRKELGNGQFIVGVDSVAFYNAFYAGSLENYYKLTNE